MRTLFLFLCALFLTASAWAADSITLASGKVLEGDIVFWSRTEFVISVKGKPERVPITQIKQISFGPHQPRPGGAI